MTCKCRCQKNASALKVNYVTNDVIARLEKKKATRIHASSAGEVSIRVQITGCISACVCVAEEMDNK